MGPSIGSGGEMYRIYLCGRMVRWTTGSLHAWHLRLRHLPQEAFRPLKQSHTGAQLSCTILEFILSV